MSSSPGFGFTCNSYHVWILQLKCDGGRSVGRRRKWWIDDVKDCLTRRGLDVRQARRMVHDRSVWQGFVRGNA